MPENKTILKTENLAIGYKNRKVDSEIASGLNLSIEESKVVCLLGQNGIGKSTLLRTLSRMQNKLSGDVWFEEQSIFQMTRNELAKKIGLVLTERIPQSNLTVYELVALGRQPYTNWIGSLTKSDKKSIHWALEATETDAISSQKCFELSDGQLQRVYIARALAQDTPLIILDEPTTHLDLYHRAYILKLLKSLAEETNKGILFSTHEIDSAIQLSDKILVMSPEGNYFERPDSLIKDGKFDLLFPNNTIDFDRESGRFTIKK